MNMSVAKIAFGTGLLIALSSEGNAAPLYYDCDTPANNFSEVRVAVEGTGLEVKGSVTPLKFRQGKYLPAANIRVESDDKKNFITVRLIAQNQKSDDADIVLQASKEGKMFEGSIGKVKRSEKVEFVITSDSPGNVTLNINGRAITAEANLGGKVALSITCSTGQFQFTDVEWNNK